MSRFLAIFTNTYLILNTDRQTDSPDTNKWQTSTLRAQFRGRRQPMYSAQNIISMPASLQSSGVRRIILIVLLASQWSAELWVSTIGNSIAPGHPASLTHRWLPSNQPCPHLWQWDLTAGGLGSCKTWPSFILRWHPYLPNHTLSTAYIRK